MVWDMTDASMEVGLDVIGVLHEDGGHSPCEIEQKQSFLP